MRRTVSMIKWLIILVVSGLGLISCTRSTSYQQDQDYYRDADSYYNQTGSKTQRAAQLGQPKKRVVVLDFWNDTPVKNDTAGVFAAGELRRGLALTQRMILATDVKTDLSTVDFVQREKVKVAQLIREGRRMGVSILVIGRISKIVFRQKGEEVGLLRQKQSIAATDVEIKVFDVVGGREIMAVGKSADAQSSALVAFESSSMESTEFRSELTRLALRNTVALLIEDVVKSIDKMTWSGRIAKVQGSKVYINAGRASGLVTGDILKVLTPGEDIYDPASGAFLGRTRGALKGTLEVVDFLGPDGAVAEVHTGANFQEGDSVQLY